MTIATVCWVGIRSAEVANALPPKLTLHAGDKLTTEALRAELARVYATGLVDDLQVQARVDGDRVRVDILLRERARVAEATVRGADSLAGDSAVKALALRSGDLFDELGAKAAVARLRERYADAGFPDAVVEYELSRVPNNQVKTSVRVVEGARLSIGRLSFRGAKRVPDAELAKASQLRVGAPFAKDAVELAATLIMAHYYDRGMLQVNVAIEPGAREKTGVPLTFAIVEGDVFRLGRVWVSSSGDTVLDASLTAGLAVQRGDVFSRTKMQAEIDRIKASLRARGQEASVEPSTTIDEKAKTVDVALEVTRASR